MGKFVRIQSMKTYGVVGEMATLDATKYDSQAVDKLAAQPLWVKLTCTVYEGAHYYPAIIKTWDTVKTLASIGILTIGEETDTPVVDEKVDPYKVLEKLEEGYASVYRAINATPDKVLGVENIKKQVAEKKKAAATTAKKATVKKVEEPVEAQEEITTVEE